MLSGAPKARSRSTTTTTASDGKEKERRHLLPQVPALKETTAIGPPERRRSRGNRPLCSPGTPAAQNLQQNQPPREQTAPKVAAPHVVTLSEAPQARSRSNYVGAGATPPVAPQRATITAIAPPRRLTPKERQLPPGVVERCESFG